MNKNCANNSIIWTVLLLLIFFRYNKVSDSSTLNFDDFFKVSNTDNILNSLIL